MSDDLHRFSSRDRTILRELAMQVAEVAARPVQQERIRRWKWHNSLQTTEPMMLVFPEGSWSELLPAAELQCSHSVARGIETQLRMRLYTHEHFADDTVITDEWTVGPVLRNSGWGLQGGHQASSEARGAWAFKPVLVSAADLDRLQYPEVTYDAAATNRDYESAMELFGDVLQVIFKGIAHVSYHPMNWYTSLRGLNEALVDMVDNPGLVHAAMEIYTEGSRRILEQYRHYGLLSLNNDNTYQSSGGNGWTDELPADGFDPGRVRPCDMWASAESQEMAGVSPAMHADFSLRYERQLLEPFGLLGYGCCEDLTHKLDDVMAVPGMRRISISPWADVGRCAEKLQNRFVYSWKPNPAMLVGEFEGWRVRDYLARTLDAARDCVLEIILKDTHTCEQHPERFDEWTQICRKLIDERRG